MGGINYFEGKYNLFHLFYNKAINFISRFFLFYCICGRVIYFKQNFLEKFFYFIIVVGGGINFISRFFFGNFSDETVRHFLTLFNPPPVIGSW